MNSAEQSQSYETPTCRLRITRVRDGRLLLELSGRDLGELGERPFNDIERILNDWGNAELFIDARNAVGATMEVSGSWAIFLGANKDRLTLVSMLTGSPFIQMSANVVKRFSELGEKMRLYTDATAFDAALHRP